MTYIPDEAQILVDPLGYSIERSRRRNLMRQVKVDIEGESVEELRNNNEKLLRTLAELQNYSRVMERNFENQKKALGMDIVRDMLPVLDSLDAGIVSGKDVSTLESIRKNIMSVLSKYGLQEIESEGKKVDLRLHEVVGVVDGEDNIIAKEIQKGYLLNNEVIRTSKVIVQKGE
ncbi:MAG: nucleotide exchange factor GrpE [Candidatus Thermoplasmatota archaeon]|jgi:molecular chaperone GrpE|nr:nucleotide exchange factor GrpE [Candidatus Thermoplasmatota archaeon]MCL5790843.1 nucleotide exchange factor GrpE [Candidatus Thermoplasmatota archaeon]